MGTKHTPGPWELLRGGIEVQSETNNHEVFAYVGGIPVPIAEVHTRLTVEHDDPVGEYYISPKEGLENAALIASAPDLLAERDRLRQVNAELVAALKTIERSDTFLGGTFVKELQGIARAAIAKAEEAGK